MPVCGTVQKISTLQSDWMLDTNRKSSKWYIFVRVSMQMEGYSFSGCNNEISGTFNSKEEISVYGTATNPPSHQGHVLEHPGWSPRVAGNEIPQYIRSRF